MRKNAACFRKRRFFSYFSPSLSAPSCCHCPRALPGRRVARGGSPPRCAALYPAPLPAPLRTAPHCVAVRITRAPSPGPFAIRSRCGRARCPHRAAAPHGAVRGLASRFRCAVSRCRPVAPYRHSPRALPVRRDGDIAPYRHYTRKILPLCRADGARLGPAPLPVPLLRRTARVPSRAPRPASPPTIGKHRFPGPMPLPSPSSIPSVQLRIFCYFVRIRI